MKFSAYFSMCFAFMDGHYLARVTNPGTPVTAVPARMLRQILLMVGLAQDVHGERKVFHAQAVDGFKDLDHVPADNELAGHCFKIGLQGILQQGGGDSSAAVQGPGPPLQCRR